MIIHKIDRSARNLRDWADLGDLIEMGSEVHFSFESIDFSTRGGRLAADIQAVIAADYIRNLRAEVKKGLEGRLKQGLYPYCAPIGYVNKGKGKRKEIHPQKGPLIRELFELYTSGLYSLKQLAEIMYAKGLRNANGGKVTNKRLSTILNNPFYFGVIKIFRTGQTYQGIHEPIISKSLFLKAQQVLHGRRHPSRVQREHLYRKCIQCGGCKRALVPEKQKGHVYYRCKAKECPTKTVREERIDVGVQAFLASLSISDEDIQDLTSLFAAQEEKRLTIRKQHMRDWRLEISQVEARLDSLTEKFVDDLIDEDLYKRTKSKLLFQQRELNEKVERLSENRKLTERQFQDFLQSMQRLDEHYLSLGNEQKRELLKTLSPNLSYSEGKLVIEPYSPFLELANANQVLQCAHQRTSVRKCIENISEGDQKNTVEYEVTMNKDGQCCAVRVDSDIDGDRSNALEKVVAVVRCTPERCHDVMKKARTV